MDNQDLKAAEYAINRTQELMESIGLTRPYYLSKLLSLCEATKPIAATVIRKAGASKDPKDADESTTDFVEVPDNRIQLDAVKEVIMLFGDRAPEKREYKHDLASNVSDHVKAIVKDVSTYAYEK